MVGAANTQQKKLVKSRITMSKARLEIETVWDRIMGSDQSLLARATVQYKTPAALIADANTSGPSLRIVNRPIKNIKIYLIA
jgi:hypothetical protein